MFCCLHPPLSRSSFCLFNILFSHSLSFCLLDFILTLVVSYFFNHTVFNFKIFFRLYLDFKAFFTFVSFSVCIYYIVRVIYLCCFRPRKKWQCSELYCHHTFKFIVQWIFKEHLKVYFTFKLLLWSWSFNLIKLCCILKSFVMEKIISWPDWF